ncbi:MAG: SPOR domain-containing protein [Luminiphilus sp.]|jgi:DedD protein
MLKQRLVGTLVLVALGIVFWPLIFAPPESSREPLVLGPMPDPPQIDRSPIAPPEDFRDSVEDSLPDTTVLSAEEQSLADDITLLDETAPEDNLDGLAQLSGALESTERVLPSATEPLIDAEGLAQFWVLQVATVSSQDRAEALVSGLRERQYKAFSSQFQKEGKTLYRIQIGPNVERQRLENIKPEVDRAIAVESQILRYSQ